MHQVNDPGITAAVAASAAVAATQPFLKVCQLSFFTLLICNLKRMHLAFDKGTNSCK